MPQKSRSDTTPMSSVARRPATLAFARTGKVSREGQYGDMPVHTWGNKDLDEDDHPRDSAGNRSMDLVSNNFASHWNPPIEALQRSNKNDAANGKLAP